MTRMVCRLRDAEAYAKGGLAHAAESVKGAGRYGDDMIVHLNKDEFNALRQKWGEPTINPHTGQPEFFLSGLSKWFKDNPWAGAVASVAGAGLGGGLAGSALGSLGVPAEYSGMLGSGLVGAGIGALTGGGQGALVGGLGGALAGPYLNNLIAGTGLGGSLGYGTENTFGGLLSGASTPGGSATTPQTPHGGMTDAAMGNSVATTGTTPTGGGGTGVGGGGLANLGKYLGLAAGIGALATGANRYNPKAQQTAVNNANAQNAQHLTPVSFDRQNLSGNYSPQQYYTYGQNPSLKYFSNNQIPSSGLGYAGGGDVQVGNLGPVGPATTADQGIQGGPAVGAVDGPGTGRSDSINAKLSDGEYVIDAETTALLGDGSSKAGADWLDDFRSKVRQIKGPALAKGDISPDMKPPEYFLGNLQ